MPIVYTVPKSSGNSSSNPSDIIPGVGSPFVDVPAGWVYFFAAVDAANPVINIGTTPGGNEIGQLDLTGVGVASITSPYYFGATTRVYFTGFTPTTQFFLKR